MINIVIYYQVQVDKQPLWLCLGELLFLVFELHRCYS